MPNHILDDYVDSLKPHLRQLPLPERQGVLAQVRSHLEEEIAHRRKEDPSLSVDEATLQATAAFGDPQDIGVAYGSGGGVVRKSTGEVLLHVAVLGGRGMARGVGKAVKWGAIAVAFLLVLAAVVFVTLAIVYQPTVEKGLETAASYHERRLVERSGSADTDTATFTDSFSISDRTVSSSFQLAVTPTKGPASGCMTVVITGPGPTRVYDSAGNCEAQNFQTSFTKVGTYTIEYRLVAFSGVYGVSGRAVDRTS